MHTWRTHVCIGGDNLKCFPDFHPKMGQNSVLTVVYVPSSLDSGVGIDRDKSALLGVETSLV